MLAKLVAAGLAPAPAPIPARATAVPWATGAAVVSAHVPIPAAVQAPAAVAVAPAIVDRPWYDAGERGASQAGNPTMILLCGMKNGGFFRATLPADLVRAIAHGKVHGPDGKPVTF